MRQFKAGAITVIELDAVQSNPRLALAQQGTDICSEAGIEFILAVGAGSCSDTAKAIGIGAEIDHPPWDLYEDFHHQTHGGAYRAYPHLAKDPIPMGVVMTKGATGSDFDHASVLSNAVTKEEANGHQQDHVPQVRRARPEHEWRDGWPARAHDRA